MKIPNYIDYALQQRSKLAYRLHKYCRIIDDFLIKNNINPDDACWLTGVEIYVNPNVAEDEVRNAILNKRNNE